MSGGMMSNAERLIYMANQIARNFEVQGHDRAAAATAEHLRKFWDPHMRAHIRDLARTHMAAFSPAAGAAVALLGDAGGSAAG